MISFLNHQPSIPGISDPMATITGTGMVMGGRIRKTRGSGGKSSWEKPAKGNDGRVE